MSVAKSARNVWCDTCKDAWGKNKDGSWHTKSMKQSWVTIMSELPKAKGQVRHYCLECVREGEKAVGLTLTQQLAYANGMVEFNG
ncbi:MAG: hypothetical protein WCK79_08090 [Actinomycetes bacterium]